MEIWEGLAGLIAKSNPLFIASLAAALGVFIGLFFVLPEILFWQKLRRLENEVTHLHQTLRRLETRLARVLAQQAPQGPREIPKDESNFTEIH